MKKPIKLHTLLLIAAYPLLFITLPAQSPSSYAISGSVHDGSGRGVAEVRVCAFPAERGRDVLCARSDGEGRFNLKVEEAGTYILAPEKDSEGYVSQFLSFYRAPTPAISEVAISGSNAHPFISILFGPKNGVLTGSSVDEATGLPVENIKITMCHAADQQECFSTSAKSADGKFRVSAPHVPFTLRITADGYEDWFGVSGTDEKGSLTVASDASVELDVYLKRRQEAADRALNEAEKQLGVNLPAPLQLSPAENIELDYFPRLTKLEWSPVEGAISYAVEIDYCRGGEKVRQCANPQPLTVRGNPPVSGIINTNYEFQFIGAQPGRWRVWAVDREGREGFKSQWKTFFYLK